MVSVIAANQLTVEDLESRFDLSLIRDPSFCPEFQADHGTLSALQQGALDRVQNNFLALLKRSQVLENIVKMVVLSTLLDLAGFYAPPYAIEAETSVELAVEEGDEVIRGRMDVLVLNRQLWLVVIESKRPSFDVMSALPQTLAYLLGNPHLEKPSYGLMTNGNTFLFVKLVRQPQAQYGFSRLFSLVNPDNDLYSVLGILQHLGTQIRPD